MTSFASRFHSAPISRAPHPRRGRVRDPRGPWTARTERDPAQGELHSERVRRGASLASAAARAAGATRGRGPAARRAICDQRRSRTSPHRLANLANARRTKAKRRQGTMAERLNPRRPTTHGPLRGPPRLTAPALDPARSSACAGSSDRRSSTLRPASSGSGASCVGSSRRSSTSSPRPAPRPRRREGRAPSRAVAGRGGDGRVVAARGEPRAPGARTSRRRG